MPLSRGAAGTTDPECAVAVQATLELLAEHCYGWVVSNTGERSAEVLRGGAGAGIGALVG
jgi:hypothetical protein